MLTENMKQARLFSENDVNDVLKKIQAESMKYISSRKKKSNPDGLLTIEEFLYILKTQFSCHLVGVIHKTI